MVEHSKKMCKNGGGVVKVENRVIWYVNSPLAQEPESPEESGKGSWLLWKKLEEPDWKRRILAFQYFKVDIFIFFKFSNSDIKLFFNYTYKFYGLPFKKSFNKRELEICNYSRLCQKCIKSAIKWEANILPQAQT